MILLASEKCIYQIYCLWYTHTQRHTWRKKRDREREKGQSQLDFSLSPLGCYLDKLGNFYLHVYVDFRNRATGSEVCTVRSTVFLTTEMEQFNPTVPTLTTSLQYADPVWGHLLNFSKSAVCVQHGEHCLLRISNISTPAVSSRADVVKKKPQHIPGHCPLRVPASLPVTFYTFCVTYTG